MSPTTFHYIRQATVHLMVVSVWAIFWASARSSSYQFRDEVLIAVSPALVVGLIVSLGLAIYGFTNLGDPGDWRELAYAFYLISPFLTYATAMTPMAMSVY